MTDIDNLRLLAVERAADDPMAAYALDGCADEIERLRSALQEIADFEPANPWEDKECQAMAATALKEAKE